MMSCKSLIALQDPLDPLRDGVVLVAHDERVQNARGRSQRIHRRVDAHLDNLPRELRGGVQVGEGGGRRRIGVVVGGPRR